MPPPHDYAMDARLPIRLRLRITMQRLETKMMTPMPWFFVVVALLVMTGQLLGNSDPTNCQALMTGGAWSSSSFNRTTGGLQPDATWEPGGGCRVKKYRSQDIQDCFPNRRITFVGDSTIRQIFWAAALELDPEKANDRLKALTQKTAHDNNQFESHGVTLSFVWDPWLNSTAAWEEIGLFRSHIATIPDSTNHLMEKENRASLLLVGTPGLWHTLYSGSGHLRKFGEAIDTLSRAIDTTLEDSIKSPPLNPGPDDDDVSAEAGNDQILVSPVIYPHYDELTSSRAKEMTPFRLGQLNSYLDDHATSRRELGSRVLWTYNEMTSAVNSIVAQDASSSSANFYEPDGIHLKLHVAKHQLDLALNARCNNKSKSGSSPSAGTCCVRRAEYVYPKILTWATCGLSAVSLLLRHTTTGGELEKGPPSRRRLWSLFSAAHALAGVLQLCRLTDRTSTTIGFSRMQRDSSSASLIIWVVLWITAAVYSGRGLLRESTMNAVRLIKGERGRLEAEDYNEKYEDNPSSKIWHFVGLNFLPREQSEELKGLMQGVILLYHYNYGSKILWVYKVVRILIAAYWFLSAYGQSVCFLKGGDFSLRHVMAVLFRLNALSGLLPFVMATTTSTSYYFAPAASFWFLVYWFTLRVGGVGIVGKNIKGERRMKWGNPGWRWWWLVLLLLKLVVSWGLCYLLIWTPGCLEFLSRWSLRLFNISWSAKEMRFRLGLDGIIVFVGMGCAYLSCSSTPSDWLLLEKYLESKTGIFALVLSSLYTLVLVLPPPYTFPFSSTKAGYNYYHPLNSVVAVLTLLLLRNATPKLRADYLQLPHWLGQISLETYVLQYHIWLCDDATSILTLGLANGLPAAGAFPWWVLAVVVRWFEAVVATMMFLFAARQARQATGYLADWFFGKEKTEEETRKRMWCFCGILLLVFWANITYH